LWPTCNGAWQNKAALDLFEKRREVYEVVRKSVGQILSSSPKFDSAKENEFLDARERAFFFFGDDVKSYLDELWDDFGDVCVVDAERDSLPDAEKGEALTKRRAALNRIEKEFREVAQPLFARYMRFSEKVPGSLWSSLRDMMPKRATSPTK